MSIRSKLALLVALLMPLSAAADGIQNPPSGGAGGGQLGFGEGVNNLGIGGSATPSVNCGVGAIDLSTGCIQPMLGGL